MNIRVDGIEKVSRMHATITLLFTYGRPCISVLSVKDNEGDVVIVGGTGRQCYDVLNALEGKDDEFPTTA